MANDGYIKLYRKMMKWGWYTDTNAKCVFLHLLFLAQYEACFYRGIELEVGQAVTSIREISLQTGISVQSVRTAINHLKSTQEITQCTHGKFSVFTIKNYIEYQGANTETNNQVTRYQHSANTEVTQTLILRNQEIKKISLSRYPKRNLASLKTCCSTGKSMRSWWTAWAILAHRSISSGYLPILHKPGTVTKATMPRF